jgi:hypothetical protein
MTCESSMLWYSTWIVYWVIINWSKWEKMTADFWDGIPCNFAQLAASIFGAQGLYWIQIPLSASCKQIQDLIFIISFKAAVQN